MKTQLDFIKKILKLKEENPYSPIHICVDNDDVLEARGFTGHLINKVELGVWYVTDESIYTDINDYIEDQEYYDNEISEKDAEKLFGKSILVYTQAG